MPTHAATPDVAPIERGGRRGGGGGYLLLSLSGRWVPSGVVVVVSPAGVERARLSSISTWLGSGAARV